MTRHAKTQLIIEEAVAILRQHHPMTVRQTYYQLVSRQVIENSRSAYQAVSKALVTARQEGVIDWDHIEDRTRKPRQVQMWDDLPDFMETVKRAYRRDTWAEQEHDIECWLEKDALSGIFEDTLKSYGVTLNVGRGYDGWDSIRCAAERFGNGSDTTILYFGDFDPSGEDMVRSLGERLAFFDCHPEIIKCALTMDDIQRYNLPPDFAKTTDTRSKAFIQKNGNVSVELDALPLDVLRERITSEVEVRIDLDALDKVRRIEHAENAALVSLIAQFKKRGQI